MSSSTPRAVVGRPQFLLILLRGTGIYAASGILLMVIGIIVVWAALLPRIFTCPEGASCPFSFSTSTLVLGRVQMLMYYWIWIGTLIAGLGIGKLKGYQSWLITRHDGATIRTLDRKISAIHDGIWSAFELFYRANSRSLALFTLFWIGISTIIQLVVNFSISKVENQGTVTLSFIYPQNFSVPVLQTIQFNNTVYRTAQRIAGNKVDSWLLNNDSTHGLASGFQGRFVIPDHRSLYAADPVPGGPRITGNISCSGDHLNITSVASGSYNITDLSSSFLLRALPVTSDFRLGARVLSITSWADRNDPYLSNSIFRYYWASNTTGIVPNTTSSPDGEVHVTLCRHTVWLQRPEYHGNEVIFSSQPYTPTEGIIGTIPDFVNKTESAIFSLGYLTNAWWGTSGNSDWHHLSCRGGVLAPYDDIGEPCQVSSETWASTVTIMLDAVVQTGDRAGSESQWVVARRESISRKKWWLQLVIPGASLILYILCLAYTLHLTRPGDEKLREQGILAVFEAAAQTVPPLDMAHLHEDTRIGPIRARNQQSSMSSP